MSALDLIIARGFGPEIAGLGTAYTDSRNNQRAAESDLASEAQRRKSLDEEMQRRRDEFNASQANDQAEAQRRQELQDVYNEVEQLAGMDQNDPAVHQRIIGAQIRLEALKSGSAKSVADIIAPPKPVGASSGLGKLGEDLKAGRISQADYDAAVRKETYIAPPSQPAPERAPAAPSGYQWRDPSNPSAGVLPIAGGPADPATEKPLTADERKQRMQVRQKMPRLAALDRRIERLDKAIDGTAGTVVDTGPVDQYAAKFTPEGQELVSAGAQLLDELAALTRIPGIGTQSDLETRLKALTLPGLDLPPEVNKRNLQEIRSFAADLRDAMEVVAGSTAAEQKPQPTRSAPPPVPAAAPGGGKRIKIDASGNVIQ